MTRRHGTRLLLLAACLWIVVIQVAAERGLLIRLDHAASGLALENRWPSLYPLAKACELLGQRALVYTIAAVVAGAIAWAARRWRPFLVMATSLLTLNIVVGAMKVLTGRPKPATGELGLFDGGIIFPSGHAANVVAVWGLVCYVLVRYGRRDCPERTMKAGVLLASLAVGAASLYLNTHWITDLLAGWIVGGLIVQGAVLLDGEVAPGRWGQARGTDRRPRDGPSAPASVRTMAPD